MANDWAAAGINPAEYALQLASGEGVSRELVLLKELLEEVTSDELRDMPGWQRAQELFESGAAAELYVRYSPLVQRLISTEFDTDTPGERGLGRSSTAIPRLGGLFRKKLSSTQSAHALGVEIERIVLSGFACAAFSLQFLRSGPAESQDLGVEAVWQRWVPRAYAGLSGVGLLDRVAEPAYEQFLEATRAAGLLRPLPPRNKAKLRAIAGFYASAGAALFEALTDVPEREQAEVRSDG